MRKIGVIVVLLFLILAAGCKKENFQGEVISVDEYIDLLINNKYDSLNLPAFTYHHIPQLLEYRNESQTITVFPRNPISSYYQFECRLGVYVLWTIESIRVVSINSDGLTLRFPSQNPILRLRNSEEFVMVCDEESHKVAAEAYNLWWTSNSDNHFIDFHHIDPLASTDYLWH